MPFMKFTHLTLLTVFFVGNVQASSPDDWLEHDKLVRQTCLAKSNLKNKKVLSSPILFSDDVGYTARSSVGAIHRSTCRAKRAVNCVCSNVGRVRRKLVWQIR